MRNSPRKPPGRIRTVLEMIKFEHSVFALPFALTGALLAARAGSTHRIWLVWQPGYQTFGVKCEQIAGFLLDEPGYGGKNWVIDHGNVYYEPMNLTEFAPSGS